MPEVLGKDKIPPDASSQTSDPVKVCQHEIISNQVQKSISPDPYAQILGRGTWVGIPNPSLNRGLGTVS